MSLLRNKLAEVPSVLSISFTMPNKHRYRANLIYKAAYSDNRDTI